MKVVNLSDISTLATNVQYETFTIIPYLEALDHLEYSMGLEHGEIVDFETRPSATIQMPKDMMRLYSKGRWALLPTMDTMASMRDLFSANSKRATKDRIHFTTPLPEKEYTFQLLPIVTKSHELVPFYVKGVAYPFPFTHSPLVKTTIHPCFVWKRCEDYLMDGHNDACPTTGLTELDRCRIAVGTTVELKRAINMSWFQATRDVSLPRSFAKTRPDATGVPESEEEKAIRWFRDNILPSENVTYNGDMEETDMRIVQKMSRWHSAVLHPFDGGMNNNEARASLLEENLMTDEEPDDRELLNRSLLRKSPEKATTKTPPIPGRHRKIPHPIASPVGSSSSSKSMSKSSATPKRKRAHIEDREQVHPPIKLPTSLEQ